jgi:hypothetical protein
MALNFEFNGHTAPPALITAMQKHGGKLLPKSMEFFDVAHANLILDAFGRIDFGSGPPRLTRDRKINKEGNKGWLPFASCNGDTYLAIDCNPGPTGKVGQVILFCLEDDKYNCLADSFESYWQTTGVI